MMDGPNEPKILGCRMDELPAAARSRTDWRSSCWLLPDPILNIAVLVML